eukprot:GHVR01149927.1.p1 GENE.GHVR01149927.1~~GHVR01149927.1.p1  ORF type:complete len:105 (-),score=2.65 GHVR01149927.1:7-321(-)
MSEDLPSDIPNSAQESVPQESQSFPFQPNVTEDSVGESYWAAARARELLRCTWDTDKTGNNCEFYHSLLLGLLVCFFINLVLIRLAWQIFGPQIREMFMKSKIN